MYSIVKHSIAQHRIVQYGIVWYRIVQLYTIDYNCIHTYSILTPGLLHDGLPAGSLDIQEGCDINSSSRTHITAAPYCQVQSSRFHAAFTSLQFATWLTNNASLCSQSLNPKMQDEGGFVAPSASFFIEGLEGQAVNTCKIVPHQHLGMGCTQK